MSTAAQGESRFPRFVHLPKLIGRQPSQAVPGTGPQSSLSVSPLRKKVCRAGEASAAPACGAHHPFFLHQKARIQHTNWGWGALETQDLLELISEFGPGSHRPLTEQLDSSVLLKLPFLVSWCCMGAGGTVLGVPLWPKQWEMTVSADSPRASWWKQDPIWGCVSFLAWVS